jgi:hypothetical protein
MEDKRVIKRECSPSAEGSPTPSDTKTPPTVSSGSPPPPGLPSEVSSHGPHSPVFEQGGPSGKALVVDLSSSSDPEDLIPDTSHDFEFAQRLYDELNHALLGPPSDDKIIILNNSDEKKEEVREGKSTGTEDVVASAAVNLASTASADDVNAPVGAKNNNSDDQGPS